MGKRLLHIVFILSFLFVGRSSFSQVVSISAPSSVCKSKIFELTIHSDVQISFQLQQYKNATLGWQPIDQFQTEGSGTDYNFTYRPAITATTKYRIWYTTDLNFVPENPNFASPPPVYYPQNTDPEVIVTLYSTPVVSNITSSATCSGIQFEVTPVATDGVGNAVASTYTWLLPTVTGGLTGGASVNVASGTISGTLINPTNTIQSATYTVTPTSVNGSCPGSSFTLTVPIKPTPKIVDNIPTPICSETAFTFIPAANDIVPAGTTYTWTVAPNVNVTGQSASGTATTTISQTLTNSTNSIQNVVYTVTPTSADGCVGGTFTMTVSVKPRPNIRNNIPPAICSGTAFVFNTDVNDIVPAGITYIWSVAPNSNVTGQVGVSTPTSSIPQTLTNVSNGPQDVIYTVTPISDGCVGPNFTITVSLIPTPSITAPIQNVCSGGFMSFTPVNNVNGIVPAGTRYTWTVADNSNVSGETPKNTLQTSIYNLNLVNNTLDNQDVIYTVTTANTGTGCGASTFTVTATVVPTAQISEKSGAICSGTAFIVRPSNGVDGDIVLGGTNYIWTVANNNSNVTGQSDQATPQISVSQLLTNLTNVPQAVVYTVTSVNSTGCSPATFTVTVTVNPTPKIASKPIEICSGLTFTIPIIDASPTEIVPDGTTYSWGAPVVTGGLTGGVSAINAGTITGTFINPTNTSQTATYIVTPSISGSCPGGTFTVTATVSPTPKIASKTATSCSGVAFSVTPVNASPAEIVPADIIYSWSVPVVTGGLTGGLSGTGAGTISGTLINPTNTAQTATYIVTPLSGSCAGGTFTVTVTVNPTPKIVPKPVTICSGLTFTVPITDASPAEIVPASIIYSWSAPVVTGGLTGGVSATGAGTISGTLTNPTNTAQTAIYIVSPLAGTCTGGTFTVTVTVSPTPKIASKTATSCSGIAFSVTPVNASPAEIVPANITYSWSVPVVTGGLTGGLSGTGAGTISGTLINPTNTAQTATYIVTPLSGSCAGGTFTVTVTVNPTPKIASKPISICSGLTFTIPITDASPTEIVPVGTTYSWSTPSVTGGLTGGISATGAGTISATLINPTNSEQTAIFIVTPLSGTCTGGAFTITVTVNPKATIANNTPTPVCSGFPFTFVPVSTDIIPVGTTYSWTLPSVTGGLTGGATGSGAGTISGTLTNPTNALQTATYSVTAISGSCSNATFSITVSVNALPYSPTTAPVVVAYDKLAHSFDVSLNPPNAANEILKWYTYPEAVVLAGTVSPTYTDVKATPYLVYASSYNTSTQCESAQKVIASLTINKKPIGATASALDKVYDQVRSATASITSSQIESGDIVNFAFASATFNTKDVGIAKSVSITGVNISGGVSAGNYSLTTNVLSTTATITTKPITVTAAATDRSYTATASATVTLSSADIIVPDDVHLDYTEAHFDNKTANVGKQVTVTGIAITSGADASNYTLTSTTATTTGTISKTEITIVGASATDKIYNGTISATITGGTITASVLLADVVTLNQSGTFNTKNVGTDKPVTSTSTIGGVDAPNYYLTQPTGLKATITPKSIAVINAAGLINAAGTVDKIYDGTDSAKLTGTLKPFIAAGTGTDIDKAPIIGDNSIGLNLWGRYGSKYVNDPAAPIAITDISSITGVDATNYTLDPIVGLTPRNITQKNLAMLGLSVPTSKVYDGTRGVVITDAKSLKTKEAPLFGTGADSIPYNGDEVNVTGTPIGTYNTKDVLTANAVTYTGLVLSGAQSGNYTLTIQANSPATITPKELTMSGLSVAPSKVYDGTTKSDIIGAATLQTAEAPGAGTTTDGKPYTGDNLNIIGTPVSVYNSKHVVGATSVSFSGISLAGAQLANYKLKIQADYPATITPLNIKLKADPQTRIYGDQDPLFTYVNEPIIAGDDFAGALDRDKGENVGSYSITLGTLDLGTNYKIIYTNDSLKITEATLYITPDVVKRKYGDVPLVDGLTTNKFIAQGMKFNENLALVKLFFPHGVGTGNGLKDSIRLYPFKVFAKEPTGGTLMPSNYNIVCFPGDILVEKRPITITAEAKSKRETAIDPPFTYLVSDPLVEGDSLSGQLIRDTGEAPGTYPILQGTVKIDTNYEIIYVPANLEILTVERILMVPTAFTPNGDGLNDKLMVLHNSAVSTLNYFKVFNRLGKQVFESRSFDVGWDGRLDGIMMDSDAYYWIAEYVTWNNLTFQAKGTFVLLK